MPECFATTGYQNFLCSKVYEVQETELNKGTPNYIMSGKFDELLVPKNVFTELPPKFGSNIPTIKTVLSSEEIIKLAGMRYISGSAHGGFDSCFAIAALAREDQNGLELAHLLFASAEMISNKQYDQASRLLMQCRNFSSQWGNPLQRICYYFSRALQERIEGQTRDELKKPPEPALDLAYNFDSGCNKTELYGIMAYYTTVIPYVKMLQLTSVQAIIEAVGKASKIHVIDLWIGTGCQWTVLIQNLALRAPSSLELLTITAVGMNGEELRESGRRLHEFAKSLAVPFLYRVEISSMEEIHEGLFNANPDEAVAVYAPYVFKNLLYKPILLESVVNVIKKLRPRIMVCTEIEADHNSPCFDNRFIEVLFYNSTYFDFLDVVLPDRHDSRRVKFEEVFCGNNIRNMIACEGNDRTVRHVRTDVWRSFFRHAGFREMTFSYQAWYQARLLLKQFSHGECYNLEANGSALILGWKGIPLLAVSAWTCT